MATSKDEQSAKNREENESHIMKILLTLFARPVRGTWEVFFGTDVTRSVPKTSGRYFPVQTSHSVNKPLLLNVYS